VKNIRGKIDMANQPVYEVIKKEDITAAFKDALEIANEEVLSRVETLVSLYAATQPAALWVWDFSSRWDFDMWW
jgi:hypothetical protein